MIHSISNIKRSKRDYIVKSFKRDWQLYLLMVLPLIYIIVFKYVPMGGIIIAFKDFIAKKGIWGSEWANPLFKYFIAFFNDFNCMRIIKNTLTLSLYGLIAGFPLPIIFALCLNYFKNRKIKKAIQMITYAPHFISTVVIVGMLMAFFQTRAGIVNQLLSSIGIAEIDFFGTRGTFPHMYVWSQIWQSLGFSSIIYIATLAGIDPSLHEAAIMDGATKLKRMWHIDLPGIIPTAVILLTLNLGRILFVGFEKVLLMQNPINLNQSEIISTYVYKIGMTSALPRYSYSTAIGIFQSVVGFLLIIIFNKISRKFTDSSLF
ncbi:sugar ABC transporter permease [Vallitalea pronyensis]|uniref:Sugar ABC transporter permease n=1 Tax=Vallitalea pronyensis TaxID=1348613 RepID=A0A8J8MMX2_9FIRM|nr:ABC transporter permease subunit [Vallitalea pronyensis]QUI24466.1 sugar ABC transporter permease [Vallitalea pronyensis]